ncbi:MAG: lysophospholipid acyltransferase family protein [Candidatus Muiribacteriota bacterium]
MNLIVNCLCLFIYRFFPGTRKIIFKNLDVIYKNNISFKNKKKIALKFYKFQIFNLIEFILMFFGMFHIFKVRVKGFENFLKNKNSNISFISMHFGNWEFMGAWLVKNNIDIISVMLPPKNKLVSKIFNFIREKHNIQTINNSNKKEIFKGMADKNKILGFISDQDGGKTGIFTDFFGKKVSFPSGPASFYALRDMDFIPVFIKRKAFLKHEIIFFDKISSSKTEIMEKKLEFTRKSINLFEKMIKRSPENWLLFYNIWVHRRHYDFLKKKFG